MTAPTTEDLREAVTGMDPDDMTLLLEIMRTARDLKDQYPDFLKECSEAMAAHVDAGGMYPGEAVKPILARAKAELLAIPAGTLEAAAGP